MIWWKVKFAYSALRATCSGGSCLQQQLSGAGGILVRKHFETVDWSEWGCHWLAPYQPVPQLISQGTETSQTAVEHFNSSPKSAAWTWAAASDDLLPVSAAEKEHNSYKHNYAVNNLSVSHPHPHPFAPPLIQQLHSEPKATVLILLTQVSMS